VRDNKPLQYLEHNQGTDRYIMSTETTETLDYRDERAYQSWKRLVVSALDFPLNAYEEEMTDIHKHRLVRNPKGRMSSEKIFKISRQEVMARARIVEMVVSSKKMHYRLATANKACKDFLNSVKYIKGRTQAERASQIAGIVKKGTDRESEFAAFLASVQYIIDDIDKTYWNLKLQMDALNLASKPELSI